MAKRVQCIFRLAVVVHHASRDHDRGQAALHVGVAFNTAALRLTMCSLLCKLQRQIARRNPMAQPSISTVCGPMSGYAARARPLRPVVRKASRDILRLWRSEQPERVTRNRYISALNEI